MQQGLHRCNQRIVGQRVLALRQPQILRNHRHYIHRWQSGMLTEL